MIDTSGKEVKEVITEIFREIVGQGGRCWGEGGSCFYGNYLGHHCAIGWLLPPDRKDLMNFRAYICDLTVNFKDLGPNDAFIRENECLLKIVQEIHDEPGRCQKKIDGLKDVVGDIPEINQWIGMFK